MQSLGSSKSSSTPGRGGFSLFRISGPGLLVLITAFLVAVIFAANQDTINRALETIEITATNARDMIKSSGSGEPVAGTIID